MNNERYGSVINKRTQSVIIETNKVLKNTYLLLSLTLIFSSLTAAYSMIVNSPAINPVLTFFVYMGLLFGIQATRNSPIALILTFTLTGFLGFTMGNILNYYIATFSNGTEMVMMSLGATGVIFLALSIIAMSKEKDFSKLSSFLGVGSFICLIAILFNLFLQIPAIHLALSVMISFIAGGMILWQTNQIIHGGEKNYITATITLYVSMLNIFMTILQFFAMFAGRKD